ncbi:MAG: MFS transporter [Opitutaceae bacterium]|nr:MFS transporter [Opitutaceae bacterium]
MKVETRSSLKVYWTAFIGLFFDYYDLFLFVYLDHVLVSFFDLSELQADWAQFTGLAGVGVGALVFGYLADRFGRRRMMLIVFVVYLVGVAGLSLAWDFKSLIGFRLLASFALGAEWGLSHTYLYENVNKAKRYWWAALLQFSILGGLLAMFMKTLVLPYLGWRALFALSLIPIILLFAWRFKALSATDFKEDRTNCSLLEGVRKSWGRFLLCLLLASCAIASGTVNIFVTKELPQSLLFSTLFWLNVVPGMLFGAWIVGRLGVRLSIIIYAVMLLSLSGLAYGSDWDQRQYAFALGLPLLNGIPFGLMGAYFNEVFGDFRTMLSGAAYNLGRILAGFSPLLITGLSLDSEGNYYLFSIGLGIAMVFIAFWIQKPDTENISGSFS